MKGKWGRAFKVFAAFLGVGFFASALRQLMNFKQGPLTDAGITLGSTVLLFAGLKAFKMTSAANAVLIGGLAMAGVQLLAKPITDAGAKVGGWLRGGFSGGAEPDLSSVGGGLGAGLGVGPLGNVTGVSGLSGVSGLTTMGPGTGGVPALPAASQPAPVAGPSVTNVTYEAPKAVGGWEYVAGEGLKALGQFGAAWAGSMGDADTAFAKLTY